MKRLATCALLLVAACDGLSGTAATDAAACAPCAVLADAAICPAPVVTPAQIDLAIETACGAPPTTSDTDTQDYVVYAECVRTLITGI